MSLFSSVYFTTWTRSLANEDQAKGRKTPELTNILENNYQISKDKNNFVTPSNCRMNQEFKFQPYWMALTGIYWSQYSTIIIFIILYNEVGWHIEVDQEKCINVQSQTFQ